jgi:hypothetical protein
MQLAPQLPAHMIFIHPIEHIFFNVGPLAVIQISLQQIFLAVVRNYEMGMTMFSVQCQNVIPLLN